MHECLVIPGHKSLTQFSNPESNTITHTSRVHTHVHMNADKNRLEANLAVFLQTFFDTCQTLVEPDYACARQRGDASMREVPLTSWSKCPKHALLQQSHLQYPQAIEKTLVLAPHSSDYSGIEVTYG